MGRAPAASVMMVTTIPPLDLGGRARLGLAERRGCRSPERLRPDRWRRPRPGADRQKLVCLHEQTPLLWFAWEHSPGKRRPRHDRSANVARTDAPSSTLFQLDESYGEGWTFGTACRWRPFFLRHSIHRCMGCCAAWPMLCAGLREWVSAARRPFLLDQPSGADELFSVCSRTRDPRGNR